MTKTDAKRIKRATTLAELHALADAVLSRARAHSRRVAPKRAATKAKKETKRERHREETYQIRIEAFSLAGGRCVICTGLLGDDWHLHHIESGGLRRTRQTKGNTVPLCRFCHGEVHLGNMRALLSLRAWAETSGDDSAKAALEHRILKVQEARSHV